MVNIICIAHTILKMHVVVDRSKDIFLCDMHRNKICCVLLNCILNIFNVFVLIKDLTKNRIINILLSNAQCFWINIHETSKLYHHVGEDLLNTFFCLNIHSSNTCILDLLSQIFCYHCVCFCDNLACCLIYNIFSQCKTCDTVLQCQLLVELITANLSQIISSRIEEHRIDQTLSTFYSQRFTRTDLLV